MKNLRSSNPRRLAFFAFLLLALSLGLIFFARGLIRELVVLPLSYLFWALGIFLDTTPQIVFWLSALAIAALAAYRSLIGHRKALAQVPLGSENGAERPLNGQVAFWDLRVRLMQENPSPYFINSFHQSVNRLLMDTLSHRFHLTPGQVEERLREGSLEVPPEVRQYALMGLRRVEPQGKPLLSALWDSFSAMLRRALVSARGLLGDAPRDEKRVISPAPRAAVPASAVPVRRMGLPGEEQVLAVIAYIEKELEVKDADPRH